MIGSTGGQGMNGALPTVGRAWGTKAVAVWLSGWVTGMVVSRVSCWTGHGDNLTPAACLPSSPKAHNTQPPQQQRSAGD